jgi:3-oxoacyl-[acyl-carrier protein] reductase
MADQGGRRVALVTGGSRGIGAAIADRLARDGFDVVITYSKSADSAKAVVDRLLGHGGRAEAIRCDAANAAEAASVVDKAVELFGRLDVLVNNAGIFEVGALDEATEESFDRQFAVNVKAPFLAARAAARVMGEGGRIINIGSGLGERVPLPNTSLYGATKFAINGLTRGWARDLGPKGITVNSVQPGPIDTEMNPDSGDFAELLKSATALGRYGKPEEIADAVAFLASPSSRYITGENLNVDGGWVA